MFLPTFKNIEQFNADTKENKIVPKLIIWGMDTDFIKNGINVIKL